MDVFSPFHFSLYFLKDKLTYIYIFFPLLYFCIIRNCNNLIKLFITYELELFYFFFIIIEAEIEIYYYRN